MSDWQHPEGGDPSGEDEGTRLRPNPWRPVDDEAQTPAGTPAAPPSATAAPAGPASANPWSRPAGSPPAQAHLGQQPGAQAPSPWGQGQPSQGQLSQGHPSQGQPSQGQPGQGQPSQGQPGQAPWAQSQWGHRQPSATQPTWGSTQQGQQYGGSRPPSQGQAPYGQPAQGQPPYGQGPSPYGQPLSGQASYGQPLSGYSSYRQGGPGPALGYPGSPVVAPAPKRSRAGLVGGLMLGVISLVLLAVVLSQLGIFGSRGDTAAPPASSNPPATQPSQRPSTEPTNNPSDSPVPSPLPTGADANPAGNVGKLATGIVLIEAAVPGGRAAGSGMVLTPNGRVLTNYHVVRGTTEVRAMLATTKQVYTAKVLGFDPRRDVAVLQLQGASGLPTVAIDNDQVNQADRVTVVGNTLGKGVLTASSGEVVSLTSKVSIKGEGPTDPQQTLTDMIRTTASAQPGDSGGPMYDSQGEVTGMTTAGSADNDQGTDGGNDKGVTFAVPIARALSITDQVVAGKQQGTVRIGPRPYLGVLAATEQGSTGIKVQQVVPNEPAAKAGLKAGDTITSFDGHTLESPADLTYALQVLDPGEKVAIEWTDSSGKQHKATVTLGTSPYN